MARLSYNLSVEAGKHEACLVGISGAPCTGKTTLAEALQCRFDVCRLGCQLLHEPARILVAQGVKIDHQMGEADYDAFLAAYDERDCAVTGALAIADRTPVDHMSYLRANRNVSPGFVKRHHAAALAAMSRYRLVLYLPVQFPIVDDGFRVTSPRYQLLLDRAIRQMLAEVAAPVVELRGDRERRLQAALAAIRRAWPLLTEQESGMASMATGG